MSQVDEKIREVVADALWAYNVSGDVRTKSDILFSKLASHGFAIEPKSLRESATDFIKFLSEHATNPFETDPSLTIAATSQEVASEMTRRMIALDSIVGNPDKQIVMSDPHGDIHTFYDEAGDGGLAEVMGVDPTDVDPDTVHMLATMIGLMPNGGVNNEGVAELLHVVADKLEAAESAIDKMVNEITPRIEKAERIIAQREGQS